jgi:hypothetical protein
VSNDIYHIEWNELKQLDYIFQVPSCVEKCRRNPKRRHFSFLGRKSKFKKIKLIKIIIRDAAIQHLYRCSLNILSNSITFHFTIIQSPDAYNSQFSNSRLTFHVLRLTSYVDFYLIKC